MEEHLTDFAEPLAEIMGMISKTYTMARERQLHAQFVPGGDSTWEEEASSASSDDEFEMFG